MKQLSCEMIAVLLAILLTVGGYGLYRMRPPQRQAPVAASSVAAPEPDLERFSALLKQLQVGRAGAAGSSLQIAGMAVQLLDFSQEYDPTQEAALSEAALDTLCGMDADAVQIFSENLEGVAFDTQLILAGDPAARELAEAAGTPLREGLYNRAHYDAVMKILTDALAVRKGGQGAHSLGTDLE